MSFRKFIPLLFLIFLCKFSYAQLEVKEGSFKEVPGFVNINTDKMYDDNDKPNAMIYIDMFEAKKASHTTTITNAELVIGKTENIIIPDPSHSI